MVVEEIQVPPGQAFDLGQRRIHGLGVERLAALKECLFVTEIADVRTAARHDNRVGHEIQMAFDQVAPDRWKFRSACVTVEV